MIQVLGKKKLTYSNLPKDRLVTGREEHLPNPRHGTVWGEKHASQTRKNGFIAISSFW